MKDIMEILEELKAMLIVTGLGFVALVVFVAFIIGPLATVLVVADSTNSMLFAMASAIGEFMVEMFVATVIIHFIEK